jgi:hypothetical protein
VSFDLSRFMAEIGQLGALQSPAYFRCRVFGPVALAQSDDAPSVEFLCQSSNLPGVGFAVTPINDLGFGTPRDVPLAPAFSSVDLNLYVDEDGVTHRFFKNWVNRVIKFDHQPGGTLRDTGRSSFQCSYPSDYWSRVVITTFGKDGLPTEEVTLHAAYPRWVGDVRLSWDDSNQFATMSVQMSYWTWTSESIADTQDI